MSFSRGFSIDDYIKIIGKREVENIKEIARKYVGLKVLHVNATYYGGGVAEILHSLVPLMNSVGLDVKWSVIRGDEKIFRITKSIHNALQGNREIKLSDDDVRYYIEVAHRNSSIVSDEYDVYIIHDPQPLPLINYKKKGIWLWRCHIDLSDPNEDVWRVISNFVNRFDATIFTHEKYVPKDLRLRKIY